MGSGEITGTGHERPGEDRGYEGAQEPRTNGQVYRAETTDAECGLGQYVESKNSTNEFIYEILTASFCLVFIYSIFKTGPIPPLNSSNKNKMS